VTVVLGSIYLKIVYSGLSEAEVNYITVKLCRSQKENAIVRKYILIYFLKDINLVQLSNLYRERSIHLG
jgi:hypothetical protein